MTRAPWKEWSDDELNFLRECAAARISTDLIVPMLDRTPAAVRTKRNALGLEPPAGRQIHMYGEISPVRVADIKIAVAEHFDVPAASMTRKRGTVKEARSRQVAMFLARRVARKSFQQIGSLFGGHDHTTVIHAVRQVERLSEEDHNFKDSVETLQSAIGFMGSASFGDKSQKTIGDRIHEDA